MPFDIRRKIEQVQLLTLAALSAALAYPIQAQPIPAARSAISPWSAF
jgi:hypothetical protein